LKFVKFIFSSQVIAWACVAGLEYTGHWPLAVALFAILIRIDSTEVKLDVSFIRGTLNQFEDRIISRLDWIDKTQDRLDKNMDRFEDRIVNRLDWIDKSLEQRSR
jgi:hypothetical protein